jgi:hypothetical protein
VARDRVAEGLGCWERNSRREGRFGSLESRLHFRVPEERTRTFANISEGFEDEGNTGNETAIKMEHAKEALQTFDIRREWKIEDGLNTREKRSKACGSNLMAKAVNFRSSKVHFAGFRRKPLSARIWKTVLRCLKCSALSLLKSKYHLSR